MRHLLGGLLLAATFSVQAADFGLSLGGSLKHYDETYGDMSTGPDRLNAHARFAEHWQVGVESLYRKSRRETPASTLPSNLLAPGASNSPYVYKTEVFSYGLEAKYLQRLGSQHQFGLGVAGGYNHYEDSNSAMIGVDGPGSYYAFSASYDYFLTAHFSLGLAYRQQYDNVDTDDLPSSSSCNLNCTGLNNIVYNPYAGLDVKTGSYKAKDRSLAFIVGYEF
ncbi:MAG TPA: hypothetical protein VF050_13240 [Moraxellaceae bacterium]